MSQLFNQIDLLIIEFLIDNLKMKNNFNHHNYAYPMLILSLNELPGASVDV